MPFQCPRCHAEIDRNYKACPHCGEPVTDFQRRYEPSHPDADKDGFVSLPNVDAANEMVDMVGAARAYQANLAAIGIIRDMVAKALELGKG